MQTMGRYSVCLLAAGLLSWSGPARGADVGDALFPVDMADKARAELIYENLTRDVTISIGDTDRDSKLEADVYLLRLHTDLGQYAYLDFDLGGIDVKDGSLAFLGGVGLRYLVYDSAAWRVSAVAQVHYAPNIKEDDGAVESKYDYIEGDASLLLSRKIQLDDQLTIMPYVGPSLSILRVDGDVQEDNTGFDENFDAEEDSILGAVAGVSLLLPGQNSIRFEGRYFDAWSVSVGAGLAF